MSEGCIIVWLDTDSLLDTDGLLDTWTYGL